MAIACSGERAPCSPSRICSISSRTNSPACVEGALPSTSSSRARSIASSSGISRTVSPPATDLDVGDCVEPQHRFLPRRLLRSQGRLRTQADKMIATSRCAQLVSAHAHNPDNCLAPPLTRRTANVAVQLRLGLLSNWGLGADPFDRADSVAAGAHLTTPTRDCFGPIWVESSLFGSIAQITPH